MIVYYLICVLKRKWVPKHPNCFFRLDDWWDEINPLSSADYNKEGRNYQPLVKITEIVGKDYETGTLLQWEE